MFKEMTFIGASHTTSKVKLVEGLGVSLPSHDVLGAMKDSKIASSLTRKLMGLLFTNEEMARSSVWGKTKKPLDRQKIEAIIGYNLEFLHTYAYLFFQHRVCHQEISQHHF